MADTYRDGCIFCKIVAGKAPCYKVWEDDHHLAFLTLHPNTEGFTVLITKSHYDSYFAALEPAAAAAFMGAAQGVAKKLDAAYEDVGRTGLILEGFGVNHMHAKLVPMHGTKDGEWRERAISMDTYFKTYPGYLASYEAAAATPEELQRVADHINRQL